MVVESRWVGGRACGKTVGIISTLWWDDS